MQCKIDGTARDLELTDAIATAQQLVGKWLGVLIGRQTLAYAFDSWCGSATLPFDIAEVTSVEDASGAITYTRSGRTITASTTATPVTITVECGWAVADIPAPVRSAMLLIISDLIENPQAQTEIELHQNPALESLLSVYQETFAL